MGAQNQNLDGWFPTDEQVGQILGLLQQEFGEGLFNLSESALGACEAAFRFSTFARCLKLAREHHGVSVSAAAKALGVRQLKLTRMEKGGVPEAVLLLRYSSYLGLEDFYNAWRKANPKLAQVFEAEAAEAGVLELVTSSLAGSQQGAVGLPPFPGLKLSIAEPPPLPRVSQLPWAPIYSPGNGSSPGPNDSTFMAASGNQIHFAVSKARAAAPATYQFKVTLRQLEPAVWRRFQVSNQLTLAQLHQVLQIVMGWQDCHLHEFVIRKTSFGPPDLEAPDSMLDEADYRLCNLGLRVKSNFDYIYDFGDDWHHQLTLEKILPSAPHAAPTCLAGGRSCPLEDSGGPWGYAEKMEIFLNPKRRDPEDIRGGIGEGFDPEHFDCKAVNAGLAGLNHGWHKPKRKARKSAR